VRVDDAAPSQAGESCPRSAVGFPRGRPEPPTAFMRHQDSRNASVKGYAAAAERLSPFGNEIERALSVLEDAGRLVRGTRQSDRGRAAEVWIAVLPEAV
jgi:hypothetical protein